jgi:hypothetical protein
MRDKTGERDPLDLLLDSALATYADPDLAGGGDSGLEDRVLAALASARNSSDIPVTNSRRRWLPWAIAIPIAACLLSLWLATSRGNHAPSTPLQQVHRSQPTPALPTSSVSIASQSTPHRTIPHNRSALPPSAALTASAEPLPRLDVFPTPQPLTPQERALVAVAVQTPLPLRAALAQAQIQDDPPIRIAAIHIPPLEPANGTTNDQDQQ